MFNCTLFSKVMTTGGKEALSGGDGLYVCVGGGGRGFSVPAPASFPRKKLLANKA